MPTRAMPTSRIVLTTVVATLAALVLAAIAAWSVVPRLAWASAGFGGLHGDGSGHHCARFDARHTRLVEAHLVAGLDLDSDQQTALAPVIDVLERWRADTVAACETLSHDTVAGTLDGLETVLERTRQAVTELKPAYGSFEATLTPEQQAQLTAWLDHSPHGERRHFGH